MSTVGDTLNYILAELRANANETNGVCPSARAFYHLRRELVSCCGSNRSAIHSDSLIDSLVPQADARKQWPKIAASIGFPRVRTRLFAAKKYPFPPRGTTVRDVIVRSNKCRFTEGSQIDENAVWLTMQTIVGEQMGMKPEEVRREHRWVQDIGI